MPGVPAEQQLLAHCYAAEALCNLQSPQQAAEQLQAAVALQDNSGIHSAQEATKGGGDAGQTADSHVSPTASPTPPPPAPAALPDPCPLFCTPTFLAANLYKTPLWVQGQAA